jgi:hypothetical protein
MLITKEQLVQVIRDVDPKIDISIVSSKCEMVVIKDMGGYKRRIVPDFKLFAPTPSESNDSLQVILARLTCNLYDYIQALKGRFPNSHHYKLHIVFTEIPEEGIQHDQIRIHLAILDQDLSYELAYYLPVSLAFNSNTLF